ncbi:MAG: NAD-dependent epimerase/dehydratase family protein [bacterium]
MTVQEHFQAPRDEAELEERLSRPSPALIAALARAPGDLIVLGAGGKMGPSLTRMAKRADPSRRVVAVSRWSDRGIAEKLRADGIEIVEADLLDRGSLAALPDTPNVIFMAGQKFGTAAKPAITWAMNAAVPAFVGERYAGSRIVVFSTGNVYALVPYASGGSREDDAPAPVGEYAYSCLARERIFAAAALRHGSLVSIVRLNYAHDLRYGVLTDIASKLTRGEAIDVRMGYVNVIWQGDANALALASLAHASAPEPFVVNVAGRTTLRVVDVAHALATKLGVTPVFTGTESPDALLSNAERSEALLHHRLVSADTLLHWVAEWIASGGRVLGKPTSFERRDGQF